MKNEMVESIEDENAFDCVEYNTLDSLEGPI